MRSSFSTSSGTFLSDTENFSVSCPSFLVHVDVRQHRQRLRFDLDDLLLALRSQGVREGMTSAVKYRGWTQAENMVGRRVTST